MDCFSLPDGLAQCITVAYPWAHLFVSLVGIGSLGLIPALLWSLSRAKSENDEIGSANQRLSTELDIAQRTATVAERERDMSATELRIAKATYSSKEEERQSALGEARSLLLDLSKRVASARMVCGGDGVDFWARPVGPRLSGYETALRDSIPVVMFANQKGGVGKTTLASSLAAIFAERGERVLAIDLDYQGSLSNLMLAESGTRPAEGEEFPSRIDRLLQRELTDMWQTAIQNVRGSKLHFVPASYDLEKLERCLEYSWVIGDEPDDVRFRLARAILSDHIQGKYNRVILDAPPRFTLGFINGFCASTHLFVPTVVDYTSALAVGTFARQFRKLVPLLNPIVKFSGIIGTMTGPNRTNSIPAEAMPAAGAAEAYVRRALNTADTLFIRDAAVCRSQKISYSTEAGIAPLREPATRPMFDKLADEVAKRAPLRKV